jgi:hypothetical protein
MMQTQLALPWGGFPHSVWFKDHPQVANVRSLGGILDRQLMQNVLATEKHFEESNRPLPKEEQEWKLREMANSVQAGTPPRENTREHRTIDVVYGRGTMDFAHLGHMRVPADRITASLRGPQSGSNRSPARRLRFASRCIWPSRASESTGESRAGKGKNELTPHAPPPH